MTKPDTADRAVERGTRPEAGGERISTSINTFDPKTFADAGRISADLATKNMSDTMRLFPAANSVLDLTSQNGPNAKHAQFTEKEFLDTFKWGSQKPKQDAPPRKEGDRSSPLPSTVEERGKPERRNDSVPNRRHESAPEHRTQPERHGDSIRANGDWNKFFRGQTRGNNCLPTSMSMMHADWVKGSHANDAELRNFEKVTHVGQSGGYTGSARDIARQAESQIPGLKTAVVEGVNRKELGAQLDKHLAAGHTAIVGIKSPYSDGNHYIYVAGKDSHGRYIVGDSGRRDGGKLGKSIERDDLLNRMMQRGGGPRMVAGWTEAQTDATKVPGTASARYAALNKGDGGDSQRKETVPKETTPKDHSGRPSDSTTNTDKVEGPGGERRQIKLNNAIVDVPKNLDPTKPIHFMTYFNGFGSGFESGYRDGRLKEQMKDAPPNTVLIAARWQDHEHSRDPAHRQFDAHGGLRGVMKDVFKGVPELQRSGLRDTDSVGLAGFSAGYNAVGQVLSDKEMSKKVNNILMLDSPSSAVRDFVNNNFGDFANGSKRLTMVAGDWRNADYHGFERNLTGRMRQSGLTEMKGVHFSYTHTGHSEIPGRYFKW
jgi:hypothetical protein